MAEIYQAAHDIQQPPTPGVTSPHEADPATRAGSRAMFLQAVFSFACSVILPFFTTSLVPMVASSGNGSNGRHSRTSTDQDRKYRNPRLAWSESILDKILNSRFLPTLPFPWLDLSLLWMIAHIVFALLMFSTYVVSHVWSATLIITLLGFCCKCAQLYQQDIWLTGCLRVRDLLGADLSPRTRDSAGYYISYKVWT